MADGAGKAIQLGLIGRGIQGSRSPGMQMAEGKAQALDLSYVLCDLDAEPTRWPDIATALDDVEARGFAGVNITYPLKQAVIPLLTRLSDDARRLGAVNTVIFRDGARVGHNTDWSGFAENLRRGLPQAPRARVVLFGAGGAGAAVAYALLESGVGQLVLFDIDPRRRAGLAEALTTLFGDGRVCEGEDVEQEVELADGLVNATPVGMAKHPGSPVPAATLRADLWVADIVYFPIETDLLRLAREAGCRTLDGGGMAVYQAADAFTLFTGRPADPDRMRAWFLNSFRLGAEER